MKLHFRNTYLLIIWALLSCSSYVGGQSNNEQHHTQNYKLSKYRLVFVGDIMTHGPQIRAAHRGKDDYDFSTSFDSIQTLIQNADISIGNLETTFGGKPYTGYPMFSSPPSLARALKEVGFDVLTTSNNHSADRSSKGIINTLDVLDSLGIAHTGSYRNKQDRITESPLILEISNSKIALLAYSYGTNGLKVPEPQWVDLIDTITIKQDIKRADSLNANCKIIQIHWGEEYQNKPNKDQKALAQWLSDQGVDIIIGSHPHVVQESTWLNSKSSDKKTFVIYSMGNFISNQKTPIPTRGGLILTLDISHEGHAPINISPSYQYVFVNKLNKEKQAIYRLLPVDIHQKNTSHRILPLHESKELDIFCKHYRTINLVK